MEEEEEEYLEENKHETKNKPNENSDNELDEDFDNDDLDGLDDFFDNVNLDEEYTLDDQCKYIVCSMETSPECVQSFYYIPTNKCIRNKYGEIVYPTVCYKCFQHN